MRARVTLLAVALAVIAGCATAPQPECDLQTDTEQPICG